MDITSLKASKIFMLGIMSIYTPFCGTIISILIISCINTYYQYSCYMYNDFIKDCCHQKLSKNEDNQPEYKLMIEI